MATAFRCLLALLGLLLAAAAVLLASDRAFFLLAREAVALLTPYALVLDAPAVDWRDGRLRAAGVRLYPASADGPPLIAVESLQLTGPWALLAGGDRRRSALQAGSVVAYVDATDGATDPAPAQWLAQTRWLPGTLDIERLHIVTRHETVRILPLRGLAGRWRQGERFRLTAAADHDGEALALVAELREQRAGALTLSLRARAPASNGSARVDGTLRAAGTELTYDVSVDAACRCVEDLLAALGDDAYGFAGALQLRGRLTGDRSAATMTIDALQLDNAPGYRFEATGTLAWRRGAPVTLDVDAAGTLTDTGPLTGALGFDLSRFGTIEARTRLGGTLRAPQLRGLELRSASGRGLAIELRTAGDAFGLRDGLPGNLALDVGVSGPDAAALTPWIDLPALPVGPWRLSASVTRDGTVLRVPQLTLHSRDVAGGTLTARGAIGELRLADGGEPSFAGLALELTVDELALPAIADLWRGLPLRLPAQGRIRGTARLTGGSDDLALEAIDLTLGAMPRLDVTLTGAAQRLLAGPTAQLEARYTLRERRGGHRLGLPPGKGTAVLDLRPRRQLLGLHALLGATDLTALFELTRAGGAITGLRGELKAPRLHLPDLVRAPDSAAFLAREPRSPGAVGPLLSSIPAYPIDLRLDIGEITGTGIAASDFAIGITGRDRYFVIDHFDAAYAGGVLQLRGAADLAGNVPQLSVAGEALALPVTALAADLGYAGDIEGTLSLRGGLSARGRDPAALLDTLDGSVAWAVADGYIEGAAFDMLMTDLLRWLLLGGILQDNTHFECAMAAFTLRGGIAHSDGLYLLTRHMVAAGEATLDFPGGLVDLRIDPRARSRAVQIPATVRIRGPMSDPRILSSPLAATVDASAKLLFLIPELGMKLLGLAPDGGARDAPCAPPGVNG